MVPSSLASHAADADRSPPELNGAVAVGATCEIGEEDWLVREILVALRQSFIVPVPGLLTDRVMAAAAAE